MYAPEHNVKRNLFTNEMKVNDPDVAIIIRWLSNMSKTSESKKKIQNPCEHCICIL